MQIKKLKITKVLKDTGRQLSTTPLPSDLRWEQAMKAHCRRYSTPAFVLRYLHSLTTATENPRDNRHCINHTDSDIQYVQDRL